jgi:hypothetical protein
MWRNYRKVFDFGYSFCDFLWTVTNHIFPSGDRIAVNEVARFGLFRVVTGFFRATPRPDGFQANQDLREGTGE